MSYSAVVKYFLYNKLLHNSDQKKIGYWAKERKRVMSRNLLYEITIERI